MSPSLVPTNCDFSISAKDGNLSSGASRYWTTNLTVLSLRLTKE